MFDFNEDLLQFIWENKLIKPLPLVTQSGKSLQIIDFGKRNLHSGPDFYEARIRINGIELAGNIELHLRTGDWLKHKHQHDAAYDTIILHAVYEHTIELEQNIKYNVEVLELKSYIEEATLKKYMGLKSSASALACGTQLKTLNDFSFYSWTERMAIERLEVKVERVKALNENFRGDFTQTFYTLLTRGFGFSTNALPFELLAKQLPIHLLLKHADQLLQLEALLLGSAGFLETQYSDAYVRKLQNEFSFLARKYGLVPLKNEIFKTSRMRPSNFPVLRLAQVAQLIHKAAGFILAPQLHANYSEAMQALQLKSEGYWQKHYSLDGKEVEKETSLGAQSREVLIINALAPFLFYYGQKLAKPEYKLKALDLLQACSPENNLKVRHFQAKSHVIENASQSQGLLHLFDNYCSKKACLHCGIGRALLKSDTKPTASSSENLRVLS